MEDNIQVVDNLDQRKISSAAKRFIYAIAAILAPLSGLVTGISMAFMAGASTLCDIKYFKHYGFDSEEHFLNGMPKWDMVQFSSEYAQNDFVTRMGIYAILGAMIFFISLIVLCILSGSFKKNELGRPELNFFDRMWTELTFVLGICSATMAVCSVFPIVEMMGRMDIFSFFRPIHPDAYVYGISNVATLILCCAGVLVGIELAVLCFVSLIKKIKAGRFLETALLGKSVRAIMRGASNVSRELSVPHDEDEKACRKLTIFYLAVLIAMVIFAAAVPFVGIIADIVILAIVVPSKARKFLEVQKGVVEVKSGNLKYRIPVEMDEKGPKTEIDKLAADVNTISNAVDAAVKNELKSQRMKVDLISNVSHDLRTPLTSMISYVDILKKEGLDSEKAPEYLDIIEEKTRRLKDLTDNLFEAAKASSGNVPCELTSIDLATLLGQELVEMEDSFKKNNLTVIDNVRTENTMVVADGKLLARVIENIFGNASKYALEGSRFYIDIRDYSEDEVALEAKNISRDQLNISTDELMERFTRGEESRTTEGSGLGLAIAKDLTRMMGGRFEIDIDGDMFKARVILKRA
ncbi:MAG: HAMP domain-containing sensor histidine kinase [Firmicutes bacterium]|nr:HAMP domain-containing sensor histidine kinase [Bacillota bacterium]